MKILRNILILVVILVTSYLLSGFAGDWYKDIFHQTGTYIDFSSLSGFPLAYVFFLVFLFTLFGDRKKYWWIGILLIPAAVFEIYFDFSHIYFPIALALVGWGLGIGLLKLKQKFAAK